MKCFTHLEINSYIERIIPSPLWQVVVLSFGHCTPLMMAKPGKYTNRYCEIYHLKTMVPWSSTLVLMHAQLSYLYGRFHRKDVLDLQWSSDGSYLVSASVDNSCIIWDANKGNSYQKQVIRCLHHLGFCIICLICNIILRCGATDVGRPFALCSGGGMGSSGSIYCLFELWQNL